MSTPTARGKEIKLNEYEYFEIGKAGIKTTLSNFKIDTTGEFNPGWLHDFFRAFHWQGMTVLAFFLGSLFVQQIRHEQKSFPFLELTGEPGAGKSPCSILLAAAPDVTSTRGLTS